MYVYSIPKVISTVHPLPCQTVATSAMNEYDTIIRNKSHIDLTWCVTIDNHREHVYFDAIDVFRL